jgi:hypothetical protein
MNPTTKDTKTGTFSTWTTTDLNGTYREVGLYRTAGGGTIEKKMFDTVREALDYGFSRGYHHRSHIRYSDFLAGEGE